MVTHRSSSSTILESASDWCGSVPPNDATFADVTAGVTIRASTFHLIKRSFRLAYSLGCVVADAPLWTRGVQDVCQFCLKLNVAELPATLCSHSHASTSPLLTSSRCFWISRPATAGARSGRRRNCHTRAENADRSHGRAHSRSEIPHAGRLADAGGQSESQPNARATTHRHARTRAASVGPGAHADPALERP
jgi:hypothetical protein